MEVCIKKVLTRKAVRKELELFFTLDLDHFDVIDERRVDGHYVIGMEWPADVPKRRTLTLAGYDLITAPRMAH